MNQFIAIGNLALQIPGHGFFIGGHHSQFCFQLFHFFSMQCECLFGICILSLNFFCISRDPLPLQCQLMCAILTFYQFRLRQFQQLLGFGGILGVGQKHLPIPWARLKYEPTLGAYQLDLTEEELNRAPSFAADKDVRYEAVLEVMDMLQQNQVSKVGLLAKPRGG